MTDFDKILEELGGESKLPPCPFCGNLDLIASGGDDKWVGCWCNNCEARGPNQYGQWEWENRPFEQSLRSTLTESAKHGLRLQDENATLSARVAELEGAIKAAQELRPRDHYEIREAGREYCRGVSDTLAAIDRTLSPTAQEKRK